ncbi:MAG: hypothetical protein NTX61_12905 [Bacteroidetes bacterium]|nr:hypothetical protein [Bacteroidota bacterium]
MNKQKVKGVEKKRVTLLPDFPSVFPAFFRSFHSQALFLALIAGLLYVNTISNEYALDDGIVILKNQYVQEGLKGIGKILSRDTYDSYFQQMQARNQLVGGRYRPLSVVTFALEQQFFGDAPHLRHFINVLLFLFTVIALLFLLQKFFFPKQPDIAFLTVLLFAIHPIHTEVVANIKSRDELLSLLFIILTFILAFKWIKEKKTGMLLLSLICYFLALLSKEWGITLVALLPLSFYLFLRTAPGKSIIKTLPFLGVALLFLVIRFGIIKSMGKVENAEILNNPYALATAIQALATKIFILLKYAGLLVFPASLVCDYSYNTIHYLDFTNILVWISLLLYLGLTVIGIILLTKKHPLSFAIWFYLAHIIIISNLLFNIGAPLGERLIYHSSVGFCLIIAWCGYKGLNFIKSNNHRIIVLSLFLIPVTFLFGMKTIHRNEEWKNDTTLFIHDAKFVPNSVMVNINAGKAFIDLFDQYKPVNDSIARFGLLDSASFYLKRAINNYPVYYLGYINLGLISAYKGDLDATESLWNKAESTFSRAFHPDFWQKYDNALTKAFYAKGGERFVNKDYPGALSYFTRAVKYSPNDAQLWYDLGGVNYELKNYSRTKECWGKALELNPNHAEARKGYEAIMSILQGKH